MAQSTGICPHCSQVNAYTATACIECSNPLPWASVAAQARAAAAPPVPAPAPVVLPPAPVAPSAPSVIYLSECPLCRFQGIQRVSAVIAHGTSGGSFSGVASGSGIGVGSGGPGVGVGGVALSGSTSNATTIARMLMPPSLKAPGLQSVQSILILMTAFLGVIAIGMQFYALLLAVPIGVLPIKLMTPVIKHARAEDAQKMESWNRLYYCSRCDNVLDPAKSLHARPPQMWQLLRG